MGPFGLICISYSRIVKLKFWVASFSLLSKLWLTLRQSASVIQWGLNILFFPRYFILRSLLSLVVCVLCQLSFESWDSFASLKQFRQNSERGKLSFLNSHRWSPTMNNKEGNDLNAKNLDTDLTIEQLMEQALKSMPRSESQNEHYSFVLGSNRVSKPQEEISEQTTVQADDSDWRGRSSCFNFPDSTDFYFSSFFTEIYRERN